MKSFLFVFLLTGGMASAETINLQGVACTRTNICEEVPNDAGAAVDFISDATQYKRLLVSLNGMVYDSGIWKVTGPLTNVPLYAADGSEMLATLDIQVVQGTKCVQEGRVCVFPRTVTLISGTLVL